jgi:hypothetical protein
MIMKFGENWQFVDYTKNEHPVANPPVSASAGGYGGSQTVELDPDTQSVGNNLAAKVSNVGGAVGTQNDPPQPPNPPKPPIADADDDDDDEEFSEEEAVIAEMKIRGLTESDLLHPDEYRYVDGYANSRNVAIKFPDNTRWMGKCKRCLLSFSVMTRLTVEERSEYSCPKCGYYDVGWVPNKKEIITIDKLIPRIPEVYKNLYPDKDWERD